MKLFIFCMCSVLCNICFFSVVAQAQDSQYGAPPNETMPAEIKNILEKQKQIDVQSENFDAMPQVKCSDYYKFQSVQVSVGADKNAYSAGETVRFDGELINQNTYPVVDGMVFVRISRQNDQYITEGNYIVDEFIAQEDIILNQEEKKPIDFSWTIPQNITDGSYRADYFFSVGKKFNLGGLPFTNEVIIGGTNFYISSEEKGYISFDRSRTMVNDNPYKHIGNWPVFEQDQKVEIAQPLENSLHEKVDVKITYELYYWDSLNEKDLLDRKTEFVTIAPGATADLRYDIPAMRESVYYLKIKATTEDLTTIVNIRMISPQAHARLNYPGITKFPIREGDDVKLFSCFHNSSPTVTSGKIVAALMDEQGEKISDFSYKGIITSAMMAQTVDFVAKENYDYVKLVAKLFNDKDEIVDEYEIAYDCKKMNACIAESNGGNVKFSVAKMNYVATTILVILTGVVVTVIVMIYRRKK